MSFLALLALACAGPQDEDYQQWAEKVFDKTDDEAIKKGNAMGCVFCNIAIHSVQRQYTLNKNRPQAERFTEEECTEVLTELCEKTAPGIAKKTQGYAKDAEMLCKRVVNENVSDMLDAAALGEDLPSFCKEQGICPFGFDQLQSFMSDLGTMAKEQQEKDELEQGGEL